MHKFFKIKQLLLITVTSVLFVFSLGVSTAASPESYLPTNTHTFAKLNLNNSNTISSQVLPEFQKALLEPNDHPTASKLLSNALTKNDVVFGISNKYSSTQSYTTEELFFLVFEINQIDFNSIIDSADPALKKTVITQDKIIYLEGEDFYFTTKNGFLIASNSEGIISDFLLTDSFSSLLSNPDYLLFKQNKPANTFFELYSIPNLSNATQEFFPTEFFPTPEKTPAFVAITATELSNALQLKMFAKHTDTTELETIKFSPFLYTKIPAENLILYTESNSQFYNNLGILETAEFLYSYLPYNFDPSVAGIDYSELNSINKGNNASSWHYRVADQDKPYTTIIKQLDTSKPIQSVYQNFINQIDTYLTTIAEKRYNEDLNNYQSNLEYYQTYYPENISTLEPLPSKEVYLTNFFKKTSISANGTQFTNYIINENLYEGQEAKQFNLALTPDNYFVFTDKTDLNTVLTTNGLQNSDPYFKTKLSEINQIQLHLIYINLENLVTYLSTLTGDSFTDSIKNYLTPFKYLLINTSLQNQLSTTTLDIGIDFSILNETYQDLWQEMFSSTFLENFSGSADDIVETGVFNDVFSNDWFYEEVQKIFKRGIMTGYQDGTFKPGQQITRAEFTKAVMSALDYSGYIFTTVEPELYFSDVNINAWYAPYINKARAHFIITGYPDNTFRPNSPITRAEAITILLNSDPSFRDNSFQLGNFQDVDEDDWFNVNVNLAYTIGLVKGKTPGYFYPNDYLNRAETAALINRFLETKGYY